MALKTRVVITRLLDDGKQTLGSLEVFEGLTKVFSCVTLEPAWLDNKTNVSCIPAGRYAARKRTSDKYQDHVSIEGVKGRSAILIHYGNYRKDTQGCVLVGREYAYIDKDSLLDVTSSKAVLGRLLLILPDKFIVDIVPVI